jgi:hypothetical protein
MTTLAFAVGKGDPHPSLAISTGVEGKEGGWKAHICGVQRHRAAGGSEGEFQTFDASFRLADFRIAAELLFGPSETAQIPEKPMSACHFDGEGASLEV